MFSGIVNSVLISLGHFELLFWPYQPQTRQTTVAWWKEVSDKIFYSIYTVRLAIKFHNTAVLHSENLPSLWKEFPFYDLHRHPQMMTFKHPPHLFVPACPNPINVETMTRHHTQILCTTSPTKQTSRQSSHATRLN